MTRAARALRRYFTGQDPTFWNALTPAIILSALLFVRSPASNYIFDEQEALLANPYVNGSELGWLSVFERDFWGLPSTRSIGSYRPIPNLIWRALWNISEIPWLHHWVNVVVHALNATLLAGIVLAATRRRSMAWLAGGVFLCSAVLTEAISGVVGLADVLGGLGVVLALAALRLPIWAMPFGVFAALAFGLLSKESVIVGVPLVGWAALTLGPLFHGRPLRWLRTLLATAAAVAALVAYTYFRRHFFPVELPADLIEPLPASEPLHRRAMHEFLRWFRQPRLPHDPMNNPLVEIDTPHRIAGALRVYFRGVMQVLFPWRLSGDYSFPQEPAPTRLVFPESVLGGLLLVAPPLAALVLAVMGWWSERRDRRVQPFAPSTSTARRALLALGLMWLVVSYFPHSNIPVLLPTVRAERFWYLPVVGAALVLGVAFARILTSERPRVARAGVWIVCVFLGFQAVKARLHALDYTNDLTFWRATRDASSMSAKAHLNYSVMIGAHEGNLEERLRVNGRAKELAPEWPMAHVYYGDTLCRMDRPDEAWPHYERGFTLGPNDPNLIALGLQCLWDHKAIDKRKEKLLALAREHRGSWLAYFATEIVENGAEHNGIEAKYRPRGYDEGPKKK